MSKYTEDDLKKELETKEYEYGFYTDIESDTLPVGLNEEIIIAINLTKGGRLFFFLNNMNGLFKAYDTVDAKTNPLDSIAATLSKFIFFAISIISSIFIPLEPFIRTYDSKISSELL